ncbi:pilus assembly protein PilM [Candidatus Gottesmanbacteria bacterium]|nr:pilus assembly protein PilM [Candidatus Gottesmanbacteria bacterium]
MRRDLFLEYFPVPKYLELPNVGIDVSDNCIRFIELIKNGGGFQLGKHGKKQLASGSKDYTRDETIDNSNLRHELLKTREENSFESVKASLPEDQAYFLRLRLPPIDASAIRGAVELQIEDHVPYAATEVVFDYEVVNVDDKTGHIDVTVAVTPKSIAEKYLAEFNLARLSVPIMMIESEAVARAVVPRTSHDNYIVVNIGKNKTVISVVSDGAVWISDTVKAGGNLLTSLIVKYLNVDPLTAGDVKYGDGFSDLKNNSVLEPLALGLSSIRDEIIRHQLYWKNNKEETLSGKGDIAQVLLCGEDANIPGIDCYLSSSLKVATVIANPWINVESFEKHIPELTRRESLQYATAIGLALNNLP